MTLVLARAASTARFAVEVMVSASSFIALMALMPSQLVPAATAPSSMMTARIFVMILTRASNDNESPLNFAHLVSRRHHREATDRRWRSDSGVQFQAIWERNTLGPAKPS